MTVSPQFAQTFFLLPFAVQVASFVTIQLPYACPFAGTVSCSIVTLPQFEHFSPSVSPFSVHVASFAGSFCKTCSTVNSAEADDPFSACAVIVALPHLRAFTIPSAETDAIPLFEEDQLTPSMKRRCPVSVENIGPLNSAFSVSSRIFSSPFTPDTAPIMEGLPLRFDSDISTVWMHSPIISTKDSSRPSSKEYSSSVVFGYSV